MITVFIFLLALILWVELEGAALSLMDVWLARSDAAEQAQRIVALAGRLLLLVLLIWAAPESSWPSIFWACAIALIWRPAFFYLVKGLSHLPAMRTPNWYHDSDLPQESATSEISETGEKKDPGDKGLGREGLCHRGFLRYFLYMAFRRDFKP